MSSLPTATKPSTFQMSVGESRTVYLDGSARLSAGQTPANVAVSLTRMADGKVVILADSFNVAGNVVAQFIRGSALEADTVYNLRVTFTASPSSDVNVMDLQVTATP